jgi:hypothetical protein
MTRTWTVDSIEEGIAAVQDGEGSMTHLPAWLLPGGAREGDVIAVERRESRGAVTLRLRIDRAATRAALESSRQQLARLEGSDGGGDVQL